MDISIVIVSFNAERFIGRNLDSLINQTRKFAQVIVVDNNSSDHSREILSKYAEKFPVIEPLFLKENSGYCKAINIGIGRCHSPLILVANADIYLQKEFNHRVSQKFATDPSLGMMSPLLLRFDQKTIDSAGQTFSPALFPIERGFGRTRFDIKEGPVFSVCGAATIFHRSALEKLKMHNEYYDEDFFMFWEDFDIGWRARLLGIKTIFFPGALVYHFRSGTMKKSFISRFSLSLARPASIKYHLIKNRYLTLLKNFRFKQFYWAIPFILLKDLLWVGLLTLTCPVIIMKLFKSGGHVKRALAKRKYLKSLENDLAKN